MTPSDNQTELPNISFFKASAANVSNKEPFSLSWETENTDEIEIYKNGALFQKCSPEQTSVTLKEAYDGKDRVIEFSLTAKNSIGEMTSLPVLISVAQVVKKEALVPEIEDFKTDKSTIHHKESFTLSWDIKNADEVHVYRNGIVFRKFRENETSLSLTESFDGKEKVITYSLIALNATGKTKSRPLTVLLTAKEEHIPVVVPVVDIPPAEDRDIPLIQTTYKTEQKDNRKKIRLYLLLLLGVLLLGIGAVIITFLSQPKILDFEPKSVIEEHSIVIVGKNFPKDSGSFVITFNNMIGHIEYNSEEIIRVIVPVIPDTSQEMNVRVGLVYKGDSTFAAKTLIIKKRVVVTDQPTPGQVNEPITDTETTVINQPLPDTKPVKRPVKPVVADKPVEPTQEVTTPAKTEEPKKARIDILSMVTVSSSDFKRKLLGGVKNLQLSVENNSQFDLDKVVVDIIYAKKNAKEIATQTLTFTDVKAHTKGTLDVPSNSRGKEVTVKIKSVSSKQLDAVQPPS